MTRHNKLVYLYIKRTSTDTKPIVKITSTIKYVTCVLKCCILLQSKTQ